MIKVVQDQLLARNEKEAYNDIVLIESYKYRIKLRVGVEDDGGEKKQSNVVILMGQDHSFESIVISIITGKNFVHLL